MRQMVKYNRKTQRDYDDQRAEHEPPAAGLEGLVGELQGKENFRRGLGKKKTRPRHLNESDEKEMKEVLQKAHDAGIRESEKILLGHKDSIIDELNKLGVSRSDLSKLVDMKHEFNRREMMDQALHEVSEEEFDPIKIQIMSEETGECVPIFGDRKRLRKEKAEAVDD